jgi:hypothetical protein
VNQIRFFRVLLLTALFGVLVGAASAQNQRIDEQGKRYGRKEFTFRYPAGFKISVGNHGTIIHLATPNQSSYWEDTITIRKHNKKTEECDLPQDSHPDTDDRRIIAGHRTYAYSGGGASMNRYIHRKGYLIETSASCWRFELVRKGRPYQKFNLSDEEIKRLDKQGDEDSKKSNAAFKIVLDSFAFRRNT